MMIKTALSLVLAIMLSSCSPKHDDSSNFYKPLPKKDMTALRADLAFTCVHESEHFPSLDPDADKLFLYGRYLQKKGGDVNYNDVARYYRIAAAFGHYKANNNLQLLVSKGLASSPVAQNESVNLAKALIQEGVPGGYFDMGHYFEIGYGVKQDSEAALRYFRRAADLGNPDAQTYLGDLLAPIDRAPSMAREMRRCATAQGFAPGAMKLGIDLQTDRQYAEAVSAYQQSVKSGNADAAQFLQEGFNNPAPTNELNYLKLPYDPERVARYKKIVNFLADRDYLNATVPDIDKIVPLPPAKLPAWDGTFEWQRQREAAVAPEKPSQKMIDEMAKAKHLDPATGLPLPDPAKTSEDDSGSTAMAARTPLGTVAKTRTVCPEDGVWCAKIAPGQIADNTRRFLKGQTLPSLIVHEPRKMALIDKVAGVRQDTIAVTWELVSYLDNA